MYKDLFKKENSLLYIIVFLLLFLFFISKIIILFYQKNIWWDSAVYIGMGKYIFSFGNVGLWEASRPLVWPIVLGALWKFNLDIVLFGKLLSLFFSIGVLLMTFLIAKEIFDRKVALLSVLLLALTPTFFFFSTTMLSGIISTFFVLSGIYFFIRKRYFLSGIFFGISFMTRFLQLISFLIILISFFIYNKINKKLIKNYFNLIIGFFIPVFPYLVLNYFLYNNILHPFLLQLFLTKTTGWLNYQSLWFYPLELFKENFLYVFFIVGVFYLFKNKVKLEKSIILYLFLILFLFFIFTKQKEMRFLIVLFPYLYILTSFGLIKFFKSIKSKNLKLSLYGFFLILFVSNALSTIYTYENTEIQKGNRFSMFQDYLASNDIGIVWISNPIYSVYYNKKAEIIYYPSFDNKKMDILLSNKGVILLNTCNMWCNPNSNECSPYKDNFMFKVKKTFKTEYYNKYGNCEEYVFVKKG